MTPGRVLPGRPVPLGATPQPAGVNFAVFSEGAERIELCLFDSMGRESSRIPLTMRTGHTWHCFVSGIGAGQLYGYRAHGPYDPARGLRFNAAKLLIDPYARALTGKLNWNAPLHGYRPDGARADFTLDQRDDAWGVPKAIVFEEPEFDWMGDHAPRTPWHRTVIYETHVRGLSLRHTDVPTRERGAYAGLASDAAIDHFKSLGVTAIELMPVQAHIDSERLTNRGLVNYWGYDSIAYFAPEARYSSSGERGGQVREFKEMVRGLHRANLEVILDVVYNHTAEGDHIGPTLCFRGLDNKVYYRLVPGDERRYVDFTGTGNTVQVRHPQVLRLVMDSLRYWVLEMHVDGFRFDLASSLARELHEVQRLSSFFDAIHQDPVLSQVKLIAEPWDLGEGGYQVGNFPHLWSEWNDRYRDAVRRFWRGDNLQARELAHRLTGSPDLYSDEGRLPHASINFVTSHDGFTLDDLVSYSRKHNEANGEQNRDGRDDNISANYGVEGPTTDPAVLALRERQKRNLLATLFFSQGVPMLLGGDELGRTQAGNNNAYCQDNEVSWYDWELDERRRQLLAFTRRLVRIRHDHPNLRRQPFLNGRVTGDSHVKDVMWFRQDGGEMTDEEWQADWLKCFGMRLDGELDEVDQLGNPIEDDVLLLLLNASTIDLEFTLPDSTPHAAWSLLVDTARPEIDEDAATYPVGAALSLAARSLVLLRQAK
jgi:isoamylase